MKKTISLLLSAVLLLSVLFIAPVTANAGGVIEIPDIIVPENTSSDPEKIFDVLSPVGGESYVVGKTFDVNMIAYKLPANSVENQDNTMVCEISFNGTVVKNYTFTVKPTDLNVVFTDKFTPEAIGSYDVRASYGGGKYTKVDDGRHFINFGFKVTEEKTTVKTNTNTKKSNPIIVKAKAKAVKAKALKKKAQKVSLLKVKNPQGKVTYKIVKKGTTKKIFKYLKIGKTGIIKIKKCKLKKGTYKVKIEVKAAGNKQYFPGGATVTAKIKIK